MMDGKENATQEQREGDSMKKVIYVADDDKNICQLLVTHLEQSGYEVQGFEDGEKLLARFLVTPCDVVVTDIKMPHMSGYDVCREIRKVSRVPIIMISAHNEEIDRVLGLELGSDDYIGKPISFRELTIKVKHLLWRATPDMAVATHILGYKDLKVDQQAHTVTVDGQPFLVTPKEFDLLVLLLSHLHCVFSREQIIEHVWQYEFDTDTRQVDHLIKRLRKKMLLQDTQCQIKTVWGVGYKIGGEDEA